MTNWTDALVLEVAQKQESAIVAAHRSLNVYGLSIAEIEDVVKSKAPESPYADGVMFLTQHHESLWTEMLNSSIEALSNDFGQQIQNRRLLSEWLGE